LFMDNRKEKGFTIIELIVVISIIAVLSSIVLTNVISYIGKGDDAAIKQQVAQIRIAASNFFDVNGTYTGMCGTGTECYTAKSNIENLKGSLFSIKTLGNIYCISFALSDGSSQWCVDNTGYVGSTSAVCSSLPYSCGGN